MAISATPTEDVEARHLLPPGPAIPAHVFKILHALGAAHVRARRAEIDPIMRAPMRASPFAILSYAPWRYADVSIETILATSAKALELDPDLADAHAARAALGLQYGGQREQAAAEFKLALALDPDLHEANYFFARFFFEEGDFERAAELFEKATQVRSDDYRSAVLLTRVYLALGRRADMKKRVCWVWSGPNANSLCIRRIQALPNWGHWRWRISVSGTREGMGGANHGHRSG